MAEPKSHLLYSKDPEGTEIFRYSRRGGDNSDSENVKSHKVNFSTVIKKFEDNLTLRIQERNPQLKVPHNVICIDIKFWGWFNSSDFEILWRRDFGLTPLTFMELNSRVLFGVVDESLFANFLSEIKKYTVFQEDDTKGYDPKVKYIKDFKFHTSKDILSVFESENQTVYLDIINNLELDDLTNANLDYLQKYLDSKDVEFNVNLEANQIEITKISREIIDEIAKNFDIVHSINSQNYLVTRPSRFGTNIKEYPFSIAKATTDLPVIGVIDTGVSIETPLSSVLINDVAFGLNGMNPMVDEADGGYGHGTSVAALSALGEQLAGSIKARLEPHARILSMKVLGDFEGKIRNSDIANLIRRAVKEYGVKIFNLTICYSKPLKTGAPHSDYAYLLDKLVYELDILICICTANAPFDDKIIHDTYPNHFLEEHANFCTPADSMNNLTVGALGDNLEPESATTALRYPFSSSGHPALYTRKFHLDYDNLRLKNKNVFKPDVVYSGGNYTCIADPKWGITLDSSSEAALQIITASKVEPVMRAVGTSFSTPLIANMAARILTMYPTLKPQTLKALIINSSTEIKYGNNYGALRNHHKKYLSGYGKPNLEVGSFSDNNKATIIYEGAIKQGYVKSLPLNLPKYLNQFNSNGGIILIEATLCFRFMPIQNNHLAYCPINLAFGFFKNVPIIDDEIVSENGRRVTKMHGISGGNKPDIAISGNIWSQDAWARSKMLSNTQRTVFKIKRDQIVSEDNVIKVGIHCHFHKVLPEYIYDSLPQEYEYSLILRVSEVSNSDKETGQLYEELRVLNDLIIVTDIALEADAAEEIIIE